MGWLCGTDTLAQWAQPRRGPASVSLAVSPTGRGRLHASTVESIAKARKVRCASSPIAFDRNFSVGLVVFLT
eukprot:1941288-Rhodomonas_salina.1